jgi:hypothetical protein
MAANKQHAKAQAEITQVVEGIKRLIHQHGWTVISMERGKTFPEYSYTVGLVDKGLPELIMIGLDSETSRISLNRLANRMLVGEALSEGLRLKDIIPLFPVEVRELSALVAAKNLRFANLFVKKRAWRAFQVFWPDPAGNFPWDEDFDRQWFQLQPVLEQLNAPPSDEQH